MAETITFTRNCSDEIRREVGLSPPRSAGNVIDERLSQPGNGIHTHDQLLHKEHIYIRDAFRNGYLIQSPITVTVERDGAEYNATVMSDTVPDTAIEVIPTDKGEVLKIPTFWDVTIPQQMDLFVTEALIEDWDYEVAPQRLTDTQTELCAYIPLQSPFRVDQNDVIMQLHPIPEKDINAGYAPIEEEVSNLISKRAREFSIYPTRYSNRRAKPAHTID